MSKPIFPNPQTWIINLYNQKYPQIIRSALQPNLLTEKLLKHQEQISYNWIPGEELYFIKSLLDEIQTVKVKEVDFQWFQSIPCRITPILKRPNFLQEAISERAHKILRAQFDNHQQREILQGIIDRSVFEDSDMRYRTDILDGKTCIFGASLATWNSLASLTHELGHAFVEMLRPPSTLQQQILSEAFAQILEEYLMVNLLPHKRWQQEWRDFQERIDQLNYHFFEWEISRTKWFRFHRPSPFDLSSLLFRETLFTSFGYQSIYAAASLIRARLRSRMS